MAADLGVILQVYLADVPEYGVKDACLLFRFVATVYLLEVQLYLHLETNVFELV